MKTYRHRLSLLLIGLGALLIGMCGYSLGRTAHIREPQTVTDTIVIRTPPVERLCTVGVVRVRVPGSAIRPATPSSAAVADSVPSAKPYILPAQPLHPMADIAAMPDLSALIDSLDIELPRQQALYVGVDYRAYVSGYAPALDSLVFTRSTTLTYPRRLGIGIQAGIGLTPAGPQPYIGIGLNFKLF